MTWSLVFQIIVLWIAFAVPVSLWLGMLMNQRGAKNNDDDGRIVMPRKD